MKIQYWFRARTFSILMIIVAIVCGSLPAPVSAEDDAGSGNVYYVDDIAGSDGNTGTSPNQAWKTLDKVNQTFFTPGDRVLLKAGGHWADQSLAPQGSGAEGNPIVIDMYGTGDKPKIMTNGKFADAVRLNNQSYWEIRNLDVSNTAPVTGTFAESLGDLRGIHITGQDAGALQYFRISGVAVHDVSGEIAWISGTQPDPPEPGIRFKTGWDGSKKTGGIVFDATAADPQNPVRPTVFEDVIIENSTVKNTSFGGIIFKQYAGDGEGAAQVGWGTRENASDPKFTPHRNITIRNNYITQRDTDYGCNAMYLTGVQGALVEHNVVDGAGTSGIEAYYADDITIQYNEVFNTTQKAGGADSNGIDPDKGTTNILIQYNYVHDNGDGILICQFSFGNTVIRYNVIASNSRYPIYLHSDAKAVAEVYNNTIYNDKSNYLVYGYGSSLNAAYRLRNNIFYTTRSVQELTTSPTITYDNNSYYSLGGSLHAPAGDAHALMIDPQMADPGSGTSGSESTGPALDSLSGYELNAVSPLVNRGLNLIDTSAEQVKDFAGKALYNGQADLGAFEYYDASLSTATIAGRVVNRAGNGMPGVDVSDLIGGSMQTVTDTDGYYFLENVPVNTQVNLAFAKTGFASGETDAFTVAAGNVLTKDIVLISNAGTGSLGGKVLDGELEPVDMAIVTIRRPDGNKLETQTGIDGEYHFAEVEVGEGYTISISKAGYSGISISGINVDPALLTTVPVSYLVSKQFQLLHDSSFDDVPVGMPPASPWAVTPNGGSIEAVERAEGDHAIRFIREKNSGSTSMVQTFGPGELKGIVTIEADVMKMDDKGSTNWFSLPYVYSSAGNSSAQTGVSIAFSKGKIMAYKGGTSTEIMPYEQNVWYHLRLVMNTGAGKYDLFVNDELVVREAAFRNKISDIGRIEYYANSSNYSTTVIDNVKIYKGIPNDRNDASLAGLEADFGTLKKRNDGTYSLEVPYFVDSVKLTATAGSSSVQSITVDGQPAGNGEPSLPVPLKSGTNTIPVTVTAEDGITISTVNVVVERTPAEMDATLQGISLQDSHDPGNTFALTPDFAYMTEKYTVNVPASVYEITVTPVAGAPLSGIQINGKDVMNGQPSPPVPLDIGVTTIAIVVSSQDGTAYMTYTVEVNREAGNEPEQPGRPEQPGGVDAEIIPLQTVFDKNPAKTRDVFIGVNLNGNAVTGVLNQNEALTAGQDYSVTDDVYRIESSYLMRQPLGLTVLTFTFDKSKDAEVSIRIEDSTASNGDSGGKGTTGGEESRSHSGTISDTSAAAPAAEPDISIEQGILKVTPKSTATGTIAAVIAAKALDQVLLTVSDRKSEVKRVMIEADLASRPASIAGIQFSISQDVGAAGWKNEMLPVVLRIPAESGGAADPDYWTVWLETDGGEKTQITNAKYDTLSREMVLKVKRGGRYIVETNYQTFADIQDLPWARKAIEALASKGILQGVSQERFTPERPVNRADFLIMLAAALELTAGPETGDDFADVHSSDYYYEAVKIAKSLGVITGDSKGNFHPEQPITRQDMMVMADRALEALGQKAAVGASSSAILIRDGASISDYAKDAVMRMLKNGWVQGYGGEVQPLNPATRAEAAVLIYRIYGWL